MLENLSTPVAIGIISGITGAIAGSLTTIALTRWLPRIGKLILSRPRRYGQTKVNRLWDRYGVWRTTKATRKWFSKNTGITNISINQYNEKIGNKTSREVKPTIFAFMELKQPILAPRFNDHLIAAATEELAKNGQVVKLAQPQIGNNYSHAGGQPSDPKEYRILYNGTPAHAKTIEEKADIERKCVEAHYWRFIEECKRKRYQFGREEKTEGKTTWYYNTTIKKEDAGSCKRCWETSKTAP